MWQSSWFLCRASSRTLFVSDTIDLKICGVYVMKIDVRNENMLIISFIYLK